jgi:hypothetical protein
MRLATLMRLAMTADPKSTAGLRIRYDLLLGWMRSSGQAWLLDHPIAAVRIHPLHPFKQRRRAHTASGLDVVDLDSPFAALQTPASDEERAVQPGHYRTLNYDRTGCGLPPT